MLRIRIRIREQNHDQNHNQSQNREQATGFHFHEPTPASLLECLKLSLATYRTPSRFRQLQKNAMVIDFDWKHPASEYLALYHNLINSRDCL